jgi:hypothetical protein
MKPNKSNQGEGNRDADRHYREGVKEFIQSGDVEQAAKEAKNALEADPAGAKRDEQAGKRGPQVKP